MKTIERHDLVSFISGSDGMVVIKLKKNGDENWLK